MYTFISKEHRCQCGKLLLKGIIYDGFIEIKCRRCGKINKIGDSKETDAESHYLLIINKKGIITDVSESIKNILGYSSTELIGKSYIQIHPTLSSTMAKKIIESEYLSKREKSFQFDTFHISKEGKKVFVKVILKLDNPSDKGSSILVIAELQKNKDISKKNSKKLKVFDNNNCDFYFDLDKTGLGEYMSPEVEEIFGFNQEKFIGKSYFDFVPIATLVELKEVFDHFSSLSQPFKILHFATLNSQNQTIQSENYFTPRFNDSGKFIGYRVLGWLLKKSKKTV